jgi:hypothetical protein
MRGVGGESAEEVGGLQELSMGAPQKEEEMVRRAKNEGPVSNGWLARLARFLFCGDVGSPMVIIWVIGQLNALAMAILLLSLS